MRVWVQSSCESAGYRTRSVTSAVRMKPTDVKPTDVPMEVRDDSVRCLVTCAHTHTHISHRLYVRTVRTVRTVHLQSRPRVCVCGLCFCSILRCIGTLLGVENAGRTVPPTLNERKCCLCVCVCVCVFVTNCCCLCADTHRARSDDSTPKSRRNRRALRLQSYTEVELS